MFKVGDKVKIVGAGAYYGGLGGDAGELVPARVKTLTHTIMQVSAARNEYLLREIYSWVPAAFVQLTVAVPAAGTAGSVESSIRSEIVTSEAKTGSQSLRRATPFPVDVIDCYVTNLVTGTKVVFGMAPETVTDNMIATFEDQVTKSRTTPYKAYSNSGPRDVGFTITLYDDYCMDGILKTVRRLQALTVPESTGGYIKEPRCRVRIGKFIDIVGVCLTVSVEWATPYKEGVYSKADVTFSFNEIEDKSRYASDWEE